MSNVTMRLMQLTIDRNVFDRRLSLHQCGTGSARVSDGNMVPRLLPKPQKLDLV
jgi:hypothetical protein